MKIVRKTFIALIATGLLITAWYGYRLVWGRPLNIDHFADRSMLETLSHVPELLTFLGFIENSPIDFHSNQWSDLSPAGQASRRTLLDDQYDILQGYKKTDLDGQQLLTLELLEWNMSTNMTGIFPYHFTNIIYQGPYPANQLDGLQVFPIKILNQMQQVNDERSARRYVERMAALPAYVDSLLEAITFRVEIGVVPPRVIVEQLITQIDELLRQPAQEWSIHQTLTEHLSSLELQASVDEELLGQSSTLISSEIIPAYREYRSLLDRLVPQAPEDVGMWTLPDGDAYYKELLRIHTTSDLTPSQIHQMGLDRVATLQEEMITSLEELGYREGSLPQRLGLFSDDAPSRYSDTDDSRAQILADYSRMLENLKIGVRRVFSNMPEIPLEVQAVPAYREAGAAGAYYDPPAIDGSRPGVFFVNLRSPGAIEEHRMLTLAAHEGIPGHHFETATGQMLDGLPVYRRNGVITSYSEGWALYAERLVYELGLHDKASNLGRLQDEMLRAARLVVDTGIHAKRWRRQQAIDYMREQTGMPEPEVATEIDRYIVLPGQACAYMVGMLEILSMRKEARQRQQERFELSVFHESILENGALPLALLRSEVETKLQ